MNGGETDARMIGYDRLGAVPVVGVKIPDRNSLRAILQSIERGNRDVVEVTKAHRLIASGMVSRRSHQTKTALAAQGRARDFDRGAGGPRCMLINLRMRRRIGVEIMQGFAHACDVLGRMSAQQHLGRRFRRLPPFPIWMPLPKQSRA